MSNLPIYRAKKIDSDEYAYGFCFYDEVRKEMFISNDAKNLYTNRFRVDTTTLSIHFPDMIDSQGNKIFASLQEDGKGGDILGDVRIKFCQEDFIFKIQPIGYNYWNKINSSILYFFGRSIIKGIQE
ncbi:hypothetical protein N5U36_00375 [Aliarcobacter butzleri]|uniref:hypothetical protein n=1 Tax=Aliarcobacter butzleri TaxID=28197 RepID=UPI0021B377F2|nr:hypothetical protein [Aliarcobacter butzleri]MCT7633887.1 hypothetical protein [Aliarcobacter butzleri]